MGVLVNSVTHLHPLTSTNPSFYFDWTMEMHNKCKIHTSALGMKKPIDLRVGGL